MNLVKTKLNLLANNWLKAFKTPSFLIVLFFTCIGGLAIPTFSAEFMHYVQNRQGYNIPDILLENIPAMDVSMPIFILLNGTILATIIYLLPHPNKLLVGFMSFVIMIGLRYLFVYLLPLETPPHSVPLIDPVLARYIYNHEIINKDLFFSGHASVMCLCVYLVKNRPLKILNLIAAVTLSFLLLVQHIHYTIDILGAPLFSFISYFFSKTICQRFIK